MSQLERDKRIHQKLKRFKTKHAQMRHLFQEVSVSDMLKPLGLWGVAQLTELNLDTTLVFRMRSLLIQTMWRWTGFWMCPTV